MLMVMMVYLRVMSFNPQRGGYKRYFEVREVSTIRGFQSPKGRLQTL